MLGDVEPQALKNPFQFADFWFPSASFRPETAVPGLISCSPVVLSAGTTGPFTSIRKKSRLRLSSSGGGLFDGRPETQTWVWGAFVFLGEIVTQTRPFFAQIQGKH
jgi:hypothetical protein